MQSGQDIQPSYIGFIENRDDALILIEACLRGSLHWVDRRPTSSEQPSVATSGCIFVYEEQLSGIQRWTDRRKWSSSRVLGDFLIYGEQSASPRQSPSTVASDNQPRLVKVTAEGWNQGLHRPLTGSLRVSSLSVVKKTIKVQASDDSNDIWHVVSYYRPVDVLQGLLQTPSMNQGCVLQPWHPPSNSIPFAFQSDNSGARVCGMSLPMHPYNSSHSAEDHVQRSWALWRDSGHHHPGAHQDAILDLEKADDGAVSWYDGQWTSNLPGHGGLVPNNGSVWSCLNPDLNGQTLIGKRAPVDGCWR